MPTKIAGKIKREYQSILLASLSLFEWLRDPQIIASTKAKNTNNVEPKTNLSKRIR